MAALCNRAGHYIFALWLLLSIFLSFFLAYSQPSQIGCLPYFHTWCGLRANLRWRSKTCWTRLAEIQDAKTRQKSPSGHHCTTLSDYIFATKAHVDNRKKTVQQQYLLDMSSEYGKVWPTNGWDRFGYLGHPIPNVNGFRVLAALLHGTLVVGVSRTLRPWTEGATYIRQGGHHVGHWLTF